MAITAVILAAGQGTRMKSALPKVLHPILGRPLVSWVVDAARIGGAGRVVIVVGHGAQEVEALFADDPDVVFATQEVRDGTGGALRSALPQLEPGRDDELLVLCGDVPLIDPQELRALHSGLGHSKASVLGFVTPQPGSYGRLIGAQTGRVTKIIEAKDASPDQLKVTAVNSGTYAFRLDFVRDAIDELSTENAQGELYLTDLIEAAGGAPVVLSSTPERLEGANDRRGLAQLARSAQSLVNEALMQGGVTLEDPATAWIDADVRIGADTLIEPSVRIKSGSRIGANCRIGQGAVITASELADGVVLQPYCVLEEARVGAAAQVGPYGRLRPKAQLGPGSKVGNFVEVKNAVLGAGAKVNHLAYIGDASVGAGANVGAGTITCNYDGAKKHRTEIGAGSFVGSNSTLVAPVTIEEGCYVAAGSVVTMTVPEDSLAVARSKQRNISGWVSRKAPKKEKK